MKKNWMILMIGCPGSGKSTLAKQWAGQVAVICSADDYFINSETGAYEWDAKYLGSAHRFCQQMAASVVRQGKCLIIDNTNIRPQDRQFYKELAERNGYEYEEHLVREFNVDLCFSRNSHGVPREVIQRMVDSLKKEFGL